MQNTILDLNNHLFAQMERINKEEITKDELKTEIQRTNAIASLATQMINNMELALKIQTVYGQDLDMNGEIPTMLMTSKPKLQKVDATVAAPKLLKMANTR